MILLYGVIVAGTILACEVALRLPLARTVSGVTRASRRAAAVMGSRAISDTWKEKVLPAYAGRMMRGSLMVFVFLAAIAAPLVLLTALATGSLGAASATLMRPGPLLVMFAFGAGYVWLRTRRGGGAGTAGRAKTGAAPGGSSGGPDTAAMSGDYSAFDKALHRIVLGMPALSEMLSDIDAGLAKGAEARDPVVVTGLARAGTTVLMRALHETGQFASLTYADMPMVMAPNLWAKMTGRSRKARVARERAHGDGVMVDFDAPEALEEVFWRSHCGKAYIRPEGLVPHDPDAETIDAWRAYQARVCHRYGRPRYLAKNNNMMLRIGPLARALPQARFLVPVRDPLAQARSLMTQHLRFGAADAFTRQYMSWLVHHEFGPDQRPFLLPGEPVPDGPRDRIDYWLTQWIACYDWLTRQIDAAAAEGGTGNIRPVIYERLGADPSAWEAAAAFAGIPAAPASDFRPAPPPETTFGADPGLVARAREIHAGLERRAGARAAA